MTDRIHESAKGALRRELIFLSSMTEIDLRWLRLFYLYGVQPVPTSLYSQFCAAVARGDRQFNMSPGMQLRDFMKVEDAGADIVNVALAPQAPRVINICSGKPTTVLKIVEQWRAEMGAKIELSLGALDYPTYEPFAFWGDNGRLSALLGRQASAQVQVVG